MVRLEYPSHQFAGDGEGQISRMSQRQSPVESPRTLKDKGVATWPEYAMCSRATASISRIPKKFGAPLPPHMNSITLESVVRCAAHGSLGPLGTRRDLDPCGRMHGNVKLPPCQSLCYLGRQHGRLVMAASESGPGGTPLCSHRHERSRLLNGKPSHQ